MRDASLHVIIIGGGASGTLLAIALLRAPRSVTVTIIEPRPLLARGFAYGEAAPFHLLNVRAANMSAHQDAPDHFLDWLDGSVSVAGVTGEGRFQFAPRRMYGRYLAEQLDNVALSSVNQDRLRRIRGEAISLARTGGGISVALSDHRTIAGDVAVIATGYSLREPPGIPHLVPSWKAIEPASLAGVENVLILGTGHSAIDHVQLLLAAGYKGKFALMSRHGFLPAEHKPIEPSRIATADIPFGQRLSAVWRWFRSRVADFERGGGDWRSVLDGMRPHAQAFWQSLAIEEQRRFIRHARPWYDVRRHRLAPSIRATLDQLESEGRLRVIAARVRSITDTGSEAEVTFRRRSSAVDEILRVQGIVECIGFNLDPRTARNPLLTSLLDQGLAQPGPHGLGLKVSPACGLMDADGRAASDLFAVGPLTRGQFWEAVGLPDVRQQCAQLALLLSAARPDV
jgi:uncharacterized NAD(P)/FAD-binding protein YdhS